MAKGVVFALGAVSAADDASVCPPHPRPSSDGSRLQIANNQLTD